MAGKNERSNIHGKMIRKIPQIKIIFLLIVVNVLVYFFLYLEKLFFYNLHISIYSNMLLLVNVGTFLVLGILIYLIKKRVEFIYALISVLIQFWNPIFFFYKDDIKTQILSILVYFFFYCIILLGSFIGYKSHLIRNRNKYPSPKGKQNQIGKIKVYLWDILYATKDFKIIPTIVICLYTYFVFLIGYLIHITPIILIFISLITAGFILSSWLKKPPVWEGLVIIIITLNKDFLLSQFADEKVLVILTVLITFLSFYFGAYVANKCGLNVDKIKE